MPYKVAEGHDVALLSLTDISPQPQTAGMQVTRRTHGGDGSVYDEGLYVEMQFSLLGTAAQYQAMLAQFGLDAARHADVTVYVRDDQYQWVRMNGVAVRPQIGQDGEWRDFFPRRIVILIRDLAAAG